MSFRELGSTKHKLSIISQCERVAKLIWPQAIWPQALKHL